MYRRTRAYVANFYIKIIFDYFRLKTELFSIFPIIYGSRLLLEKKSEVNPSFESFIWKVWTHKQEQNLDMLSKSLSNFHLNWHITLNENYLGISHLFPIFEVAMARRRIYREHQVSDSLKTFFRSRVCMSSWLKKIRGASKITVTIQEKNTTKNSRSISDFSAHLYGARD